MGAIYLKQHYDSKAKEMAEKEVAQKLEKDHKNHSLEPFDRNGDAFKNRIFI